MYLNSKIKYQKGFGLPSALFLIVIMVLIIASINQLNEMNAQAYGREWLSQRAFYAAESGAQLAATYTLNSAETTPTCDADFIDNLSLTTSGLSSCTINVGCGTQDVASETFITLTSTGQCGSGPDQSTRIVQVRLLDD